MNNKRRKELRKAMELLSEARGIIESVHDEEQEAYDNLPEGIQCSDRGEDMEGMICIMEDAITSLEETENMIEDDVINH